MDLVSFVLAEQAAVHAREASGREFPGQRVLGGPSDEQMRVRPGPGLNSLGWLLWHMARTEDAAVNAVVAGREQVPDDRCGVGV